MPFEVTLQVDSDTVSREDVTDVEHVDGSSSEGDSPGIRLTYADGNTDFFEGATLVEVHESGDGDILYGVFAELKTGQYHDYTVIGMEEGDDPEEAALDALALSPHTSEDLLDDELTVYEMEGPVRHVPI